MFDTVYSPDLSHVTLYDLNPLTSRNCDPIHRPPSNSSLKDPFAILRGSSQYSDTKRFATSRAFIDGANNCHMISTPVLELVVVVSDCDRDDLGNEPNSAGRCESHEQEVYCVLDPLHGLFSCVGGGLSLHF